MSKKRTYFRARIDRSAYHSCDPTNTKCEKHEDVGEDTARSCNRKVLHPLQLKGMIASSVAKLTDCGEILSNYPAKRRALKLQEHG